MSHVITHFVWAKLTCFPLRKIHQWCCQGFKDATNPKLRSENVSSAEVLVEAHGELLLAHMLLVREGPPTSRKSLLGIVMQNKSLEL